MDLSLQTVMDWISTVGIQSVLAGGSMWVSVLIVRALLAQLQQTKFLSGIFECLVKQTTLAQETRVAIDAGFNQNRVAIAEVKSDGDGRLELLHTIDSKLTELKSLVLALQKGG